MHEQLMLDKGSPLIVRRCDYDYFKYPFHFHSEYEIVYIIKSTGTRFAGNSIEKFSEEDLVLHGSFLPHMYRNDDKYCNGDENLRVNAIVIQFSCDFFKYSMSIYPEFQRIKGLLEKAKYGIFFDKNANYEIRSKIKELTGYKDKLECLIECLKLLSMMSNSVDIRLLNKERIESEMFHYGDNRIMKILNMLNKQYTDDINLTEISNQYGMNKSAFCRYFKEKTGKSLIQYVNELRIGNACRLLLAGELSISQICYDCGYKTIVNFNRNFKSISGFSPSEYIMQFRKDMRPIVVGKN